MNRIYKSYAKLNLNLFVGPPNQAGLHSLVSVFQSIDLNDVVSISTSSKNEHTVHFEGMDVPPVNTCTALIDALAGRLPQWWHVTIKKNIPSGAGLGGGSSNAATLLMALNDLESLNLSKEEMCHIATSIGSDVPFFLYGGQAKVFGTGECIHPNLSLIHAPYFVLILPNIHCSTGQVYAALDNEGVFDDLDQMTDDKLTVIGHNALQSAAFVVAPSLGELRQRLINGLQKNVVMSGSGSTFFVPCQSFEDQMIVFDAVNQLLPNFDGSVLCAQSTSFLVG